MRDGRVINDTVIDQPSSSEEELRKLLEEQSAVNLAP
jgi:hypothetical protein